MRYLPFLAAVTALTFFVRDHAFFWDCIQLGSKHAHWFYEQTFQYLLLPAEIDSGHPPTFGMYLAAIWTLFGQSLWASHFAMLPFLWGIVILLFLLGDYYLSKKRAFWLALLVLLDPVFAGQSVLISPDVVLICFFLLAWWAVLKEKKTWLILAALGLAMVSMRGMMIVMVVYLFDIFCVLTTSPIGKWTSFSIKKSVTTIIKRALPYVPSGLFALAFFTFHYYKTGWIAYHPDSPWSGSFQAVDAQGFLKNVAVLAWRMLEFGRFVLWAIVGFIILKLVQKRQLKTWWTDNKQQTLRRLFFFLGLAALVLLPSMLRYTGLMQNRYLLPIFIILDLVVLMFIFSSISFLWTKKSLLKPLLCLTILALSTGNLWIYPRKISQGWDSTLAHLPYYDLRLKMIEYIDGQQISYEEIGTRFPNIGSFQEKDLSGSRTGFPKADFSKHPYIFYANIMNDFSDEELFILNNEWTIVQQFSSNGIDVILYKKPKNK